MARRPHQVPGSRFRGPMFGAPGTLYENMPAELISTAQGRYVRDVCTFKNAADVAQGAGARFESVLAIGAGTGAALTIARAAATQPYAGFTVANFLSSTTNNQGSQFVAAETNAGLFGSLAGDTARAFNPPLVVTYASELCVDATALANGVWALGLMEPNTNAALTTAGGFNNAANSIIFRIPATGVGIQCYSNALATTTTSVNLTASVPMRFGIRMVIVGMSAAGTPIGATNCFVQFYINDKLVATHQSDGVNFFIPINTGPGIAGVRLTGAVGNTYWPYYVYCYGPIRAGATTL